MKNNPIKFRKNLIRKISSIIIISCLSFFISISISVFEKNVCIAEEPDDSLFTDVKIGHPEYVAIKYLKEKGILKGFNDGSFKPDSMINRVEALKIILEANNLIDESYIENNKLGGVNYNKNDVNFSDIYKSQWYYPYIKKAIEIGAINGYPDNTFRPQNTINRAESFKMIMESDNVNLPEVSENPFADVNMNEWFAPYLLEAKNRQIIYIMMDNTVNPGKKMTRSKFAELVYRYIKNKENGSMFGKGTFYSDYFEGHGTSSGEQYHADEFTAAHLTLPFNTKVKVTNLENGKSVEVRINDRGPFVTGRVIDLSRAAFEEIAYPGEGIIWVEYEILNENTNG
jgi:rare lipoprotein A